MKVMIVNAHMSDGLGGSEMQCDLIAKGLVERNHEVIYAAVGKRRKNKYQDQGYSVMPLDLNNRQEVRNFLDEHQPSLIYWRFNKQNLKILTEERRKSGIPMIFAVSSRRDVEKYAYIPKKGQNPLRLQLNYLKQRIRSAANYRYIQHVDAVTTLNSKYQDRLPVEKQTTIWNAATLNKEHFEWSKPFVLWVANIKTIKRPELYLQLAAHFAEKASDIDFIMIGAIQQTVPYQELIENAGKTGNFHYLGAKSPEYVNGALEKAICMIHTCEPEGFGNNFIQAWLNGCPTLTLDHDPDDLIKRHELGFASGTLSQMINDLESLIADEAFRSAIAKRVYEFGHAHFTPEKLTDRVEIFFKEVLEETSR